MSTQTDGLRRFVATTARERWRASDDPVLIVGSGKGGSGASTIAALLAIACSAEGHRTLLIDGDELVGTMHRLFGVGAPLGMEGLRTGSHAPADGVLVLGDGLSLLPGGPGAVAEGRHPAHAFSAGERRALFRRVSQLYRDYDVVVVDAGSRLDTVMTAAATGARRFVAVTGVGTVAVAATYALIKAIELKWPGLPAEVLVNRHDDERARAIFEQLQGAASRFLGRDIEYSGTIPEDDDLRMAILAGQPLGDIAGQTVAGHATHLLAQRLLVQLDVGVRRPAALQSRHRRR